MIFSRIKGADAAELDQMCDHSASLLRAVMLADVDLAEPLEQYTWRTRVLQILKAFSSLCRDRSVSIKAPTQRVDSILGTVEVLLSGQRVWDPAAEKDAVAEFERGECKRILKGDDEITGRDARA